MISTTKIIHIFLATPSDVNHERELVHNAVNEINKTLGATQNFRVEIKGWEDVPPSRGVNAQEVITKHIGDNYQIFLGIMWARIGSPVNGVDSGTVYEYETALDLDDHRDDFKIMWYFKEDEISFDKIDPQQIEKVKKFRKKVADDGCYYDLFKNDELEKKVRIHLSLTISKLLKQKYANSKNEKSKTTNTKETSNDVITSSETFDKVSKILGEVDDNENLSGIIEYSEELENCFQGINADTNFITERLEELSSSIEIAAQDIETIEKSKPAPEVIKRTVLPAANAMMKFALEVDEFNPGFGSRIEQMVQAMTALRMIALDYESETEIDTFDESILGLEIEVIATKNSLLNFLETVHQLPPLTKKLTKSRNKLVKATGGLVLLLDRMVIELNQVRS